MDESFSKYKQLMSQGASAQRVYLLARADGLDWPSCIRMLRWLFDLSLVEAKEITVTADGRYNSLNEYQESLIPALSKAFDSPEP